MTTIADELVVVSDIHMKHCGDVRALKLLDFIDRIDTTQVKHFILLGDIFDFCFAASEYFKKKYQKIGQSLSGLSRSGVQVYFFQGNHEFAVEELAWPGVHFIKDKSLVLQLSSSQGFYFSHGDRLGAPWHYRYYLALTRSSLFRALALLVPQRALDRICLKVSEKSRESSDGARITHRRILRSIAADVKQYKVSHAIVGHYHIPYQLRICSGQAILCLSSWDQPNALGFDGVSFFRYSLADENHEISKTPVVWQRVKL